LLIEDNPDDADLIRELFSENRETIFSIDVADRISSGIELVATGKYNAILLDLGLPDSQGLESFTRLNRQAGHLPIIVITGLDDELVGLGAVRMGAADYLVKGYVDHYSLSRSLNYAIERKKIHDNLIYMNALLTNRDESSLDGMLIVDENGKMISFNRNFIDMWGIPPDVEKSQSDDRALNSVLDKMADSDAFIKMVDYLYAHREEKSRDEIRLRDGRIIDRYSAPVLGTDRHYFGRVWYFRDITERKQVEETILRSKMMLQHVIDAVPDWIYVKDRQHRYLLVNKSFAEGQHLAPQDMVGRPDTDFFSEELCMGNPDKGIGGFHNDDNEAFQGYLLHNRRNVVSWADGTQRVYDTYKMPLTDNTGNIYGALVYSRDITERQNAEDNLYASYKRAKRTLEDIIDTIRTIVEMRDPYTAGHQEKVARLATAIAAELHMTDSEIECIDKAARIHDVGKIFVPSDILSRPGRLTDMEFTLIKTHAQGGYEILSHIDFGWPIAQIVLQHHERLDGSGYPNKLKGGDILKEAKIIALADVVEAMSAHRPYRPAHSIEESIDEIEKHKGVLYDPAAVDACVRLFNEKRFEFSAST
jgi:PAS domain S-box-containing protein